MSTRTSQRSAAVLALRWHAGTGALVALTAALTLAGTLPALAMLGGTAAAPALTLALGDVPALLADWGGRGIVWPQLQQLAIQQLTGILRGAVLLTLAVGAATLCALHVARTAARSGEVIVARAIGASRRVMLGALMLEAGALAGVALMLGMLLALTASAVMRAAWPGHAAHADLSMTAAVTLGITALVMLAPLLLVRALSTTRLVDDDRRPLTLIIAALQLGAALVVLAGGVTLQRFTAAPAPNTRDGLATAVMLQDLRSGDADRLQRAQHFAAFLAAEHARHPGALISLGSSGVHRGFGTTALAIADCGACVVSGMPARYRTEMVVHHAVSGDSFAMRGLSLRTGRVFTDRDRWDAPLVAVVSASLAREMFANGDAVGRRIQLQRLNDRYFTVVGVVDDAPARGLGSQLQQPLAVYVSILQHPVAALEVATRDRTVTPDRLATLGQPMSTSASIAERLGPEQRALRWFTRVMLAIGAVSMLIALGGLVSLLHLWLDSQRRELGIRRAVGARHRDIHLLVLGRATLVAIGGSLFGAWMGQIAWDVLPRIVPGAPVFDHIVVAVTAAALSTLTLIVAFAMSYRFTRTPVGTLLLDVG
jgi:hypothetical protein